MPKTKRDSALYRRGDFWLAWDRRADGSLRSPYLAVFWYDKARRRDRSASTGTADPQHGARWLDSFYLERTTGQAVCYACGRPRDEASGHLVSNAIATYQTEHGNDQASAKAISARLAHVVNYLGTLPSANVTVEMVDEQWIARFRKWAAEQPVVGMKGKSRKRSPSTIETSVVQLAAACRHSWRRGDTRGAPRFKPIPIRELNHTPQHRASVAQIAAMFRYCVAPEARDAEQRERRIRERAALHRFLILSVSTLGRPDAVHDFSTDPKRAQWNDGARILSLNPKGRRQTKKYRAVVPIAPAVADHLGGSGFFIGPASVRKSWEAMAAKIGLPGEGEAGMKLIRRSMADLLRQRLPEEAWGEISMFMGHDRTDSVTSLYAPFSPAYLRRALAAIEAIIADIEQAVPGAFFRRCTGDGATVIPLGKVRNA